MPKYQSLSVPRIENSSNQLYSVPRSRIGQEFLSVTMSEMLSELGRAQTPTLQVGMQPSNISPALGCTVLEIGKSIN